MAASAFENAGRAKIKGGKWTVMRFFTVSLAFTIGWMAVSSQLGYYKLLYGPAILLQMNIAYFLPSLPLLLLSSLLDDRMDRQFGVAKTVLMRLLFGLGGCAAVMAAWPFLPSSRRVLLVMVALLGAVSGIAFSAAYQLVARFANKNTIALGLGCVGSGVVVLILEAALRIHSTITHTQEVLLFEIIAAVIVLGAVSAFSLLIRHWNAIEASTDTLPKEESVHSPVRPLLDPPSPVPEEGEQSPFQRKVSRSLSRMIKFTPLEPFDTMSDAERVGDDDGALIAIRSLFRSSSKMREDWSTHSPRSVNIPAFSDENSAPRHHPTESEEASFHSEGPLTFAYHQPVGLIRVIALTWPIMAAMFIAGIILCVIFPFLTYVPSSGSVGDTLPQVLFFVRLFGDITGRTIPRQKVLAMRSQRWLLTISLVLAATVPLFFVYIKMSWHSDYVSIVYIILVWMVLGYVNTCAYMLAPTKVPPQAKSTANGALAIMYQGSHMLGLVIALILALALYGSFEV